MTKGVKVGEGGHLVGGLEERENGSESAGSDPAPRWGVGSLVEVVSEWARKRDGGKNVWRHRVTQNSAPVLLLPPSPGAPTPRAEHLAVWG